MSDNIAVVLHKIDDLRIDPCQSGSLLELADILESCVGSVSCSVLLPHPQRRPFRRRLFIGYSTFQKSDTNSIILIQPYFGLMKVRAMRSILQPNLIFKGAFGGLSKNMVSATT